jgi:DNA polymerase III subunit beta
MIFKVNSTELLKRLNTIVPIVPTKSVLPIIQNIHFDVQEGMLRLTGTDLEISLRTRLPITVEDSDGTFNLALPPKIIQDTLKALPDQPLEFRLPNGTSTIEVVSATGSYKISGMDGLDFPGVSFSDDTAGFELPMGTLGMSVDKTLFAASTDELKPAMNGLYLESKGGTVNFVTTDAHRLVRYRRTDIKVGQDMSLLLPGKAMRALSAAAPGNEQQVVKVRYNANSAYFGFGATELVTRLIDARFPDYENVIPGSSTNKLILNKKDLLGSLKRLDIYANRTTHLARFALSGNVLKVEASDIDIAVEAHESLSCLYEGAEMEIGFNLSQMSEIIGNLDTDDIILELGTSNRAAVVLPVKQQDDEELLMLLMPVMLSSSY